MPDDARPGETMALGRGLTLLFAATAGLAVANIYYNQPLLGLLAARFGHAGTAVAALTQTGYALGLVLFVPLGDLLDRRRLMLAQTGLLVLALAIEAAAPSLAVLLLAAVAIGVASTIAQVAIPFAAELARPERRGAAVGTVMSGLLSGILLARTVSGFVGQAFGWRAMFWVGTALALALGAMLAALLPPSPARHRIPYLRLLFSLGELLRRWPALRLAAATQGLLFAAFSVFWATLALLLEGPPYGLGAAVAGLYGVVALTGVLMAPVAGRLADRFGPRWVVRLGIGAMLAAFALMAGWPSLLGLAIGVAVMDGGIQSSMVANQSIIFGLGEAERSRINTIYVTALFVGGAVGSEAGVLAWRDGGWDAVMALAAAFALAGLALQLLARRR